MKQAFLLALLLPFAVCAEVTTSGFCGPKDADGNFGSNCQWSYDEDTKTIKISGQGQMYTSPSYDFPWNQSYFNQIENVIIADGITSIGNHAFFKASNLANITLPNTLKSIGWNAIRSPKLTSIIIPDSVTYIGSDSTYPAFNHKATEIYCSEKQQNICANAIAQSGLNANVLKTYQKRNGEYLYKGKYYNSPSDIGTSNNIKKRIYTVEEATYLSGKKNTITLRYQ